MAEARAVINVDINTSGAAASLRQLQDKINAFNSTLSKTSAVQSTAIRNSKENLLELVNASRFFSAETVKMQTAAGALDKTLSKGQVTLGQFFSAKFRKDGAAAAQVLSLANARASALQTQFIATGQAANGMREAIAIRPLQAFNSATIVSAQKLAIQRAMLQQATTSMINFGKNTQWAGRQLMVGFTVPLTIFAATAGKAFMDLEKEAVNFKKVYGDAFTTPAEMEANLNAVKDLAKEYTKYGIAVKDTVGLAAQAAAAGAQNQDLIDATAQSTRLATLGQMEQNQALETTIALQNAFKLSGEELANSINFLNMVENQTVVTLQDLSAAIPRVAPVIKGLGGNVEDLAAFLAAMQEGGVSAEQGANALKSGLASLINPTDKAEASLKKMGISLTSIVQANRGDLMGTVQDFARALETLDTFQRQQALEQVFGKFQYARLGALFDNIVRDGSQASRVLEMTGMSAQQMAASAEKELGAIEQSVGVKFTAAMERLQLAIAPIGEMFTKMAIPVINFFGDLLEKFDQLPDFAKKFVGIGTVLVGIVIPAGTMFLGLLMNLIGTLVKFGSIVGIAFKGFMSGGFKGALDGVSQATKYMSLSEIDAANAAGQLAGSTEAVNSALLSQVGASDAANAAIRELAFAYEVLTQQMREAASVNQMAFGTGAAAMGAAGKGRLKRNRGGTIPGSGNTDTVPAMLTPGEFVVNKEATRNNLPLLKAINNGSMQKFAGGGLAAMQMIAKNLRPLAVQVGRGAATSATQVNNSFRTMADTVSRGVKWKRGGEQFWRSESIQSLLKDVPAKELGALVLGMPKNVNQKMRPGQSGLTGRQIIDDLNNLGYTADDIFEPLAMQVRSYKSRNAASNLSINNQQAYDELIRILKSKDNSTIFDPDFEKIIREQVLPKVLKGSADEIADFTAKIIAPRHLKTARPSQFANNEEFGNWLLSRGHDIEMKKAGGTTRIYARNPVKGNLVDITPNSELGFYKDLDDGILDYTEVRDAMNKFRRDSGLPSFAAGMQGQFTHANTGGYIVPGSGNKDTVPAMLTPGEFVINKKATKENMSLLSAINGGKVQKFAMGGMAASMAMGTIGGGMMMAPMIPGIGQNQQLSGALSTAGMGVSMLSMLPMLGGAAPWIAGLAALGGAAATLVMGMNKLKSSVSDLDKAMMGSSDRVQKMGEAFGRQTAIQQVAAQRAASVSGGVGQEAIGFATGFLDTDAGKQMIEDMKTVQKMGKDQTEALANQLKRSILAGAITPEEAKAVAIQMGQALGNQRIGVQVSAQITGIFGKDGQRLKDNRLSITSDIIPEIDLKQIDQEAENTIRRLGKIDWSRGFDLGAAGASILTLGGNFVPESMKIQAELEAIAQKAQEAAQIEKEARASVLLEYQNGIITLDQYRNKLDQLARMDISGTSFESAVGAVAGAATEALGATVVPEEIMNVDFLNIADLRNQESMVQNEINSIMGTISAEREAAITRISATEGIPWTDLVGLSNEEIARLDKGANHLENALSYLADAQSRFAATQRQIVVQEQAQSFFESMNESTTKMLESAGYAEDQINNIKSVAEKIGQNVGEDAQVFQAFAMGEFDPVIIQRLIELGDEVGSIIPKGENPVMFLKDLGNQLQTFAAFPDLQQKMLDIVINDPNNAEEKISRYENIFLAAERIPDDVKKVFSFDISTTGGLDKIEEITPGIQNLIPLLDTLDGEARSIAVNLMSNQNGKPVKIGVFEKDVVRVQKALNNLESTDPNIKKQAMIEYMTLIRDADGNQIDNPEQVMNELIDKFGAGKVMNLPTSVLKEVAQYQLEIDGLEESIAAMEAMGNAALTPDAADYYFQKAEAFRAALKSVKRAQRAAIKGASAGTKEKGGGGGGGQKSLPEQLKDQLSDLKSIYDSMTQFINQKTGAFKSIAAGPFGPEFIEYLKSQGEQGIKILKGGLDKMKSVYEDFKKVQMQEGKNFAQMLPATLIRQRQNLNLQTRFEGRLERRGFNADQQQMFIEGIGGPEAIRNYEQLLKKRQNGKKLSAEELDYLKKINTAMKLGGPEAEKLYRAMTNKEATQSLKDMNKELSNINKLTSMGYTKEEADQIMQLGDVSALTDGEIRKLAAGIRSYNQALLASDPEALAQSIRDNAMQINDLRRQIAEIEKIKPLQDQVDAQQKIIDGQEKIVRAKQQEIDLISRSIELKQRELEPIDKQISAYEDQIDAINESYDAQIEALDKIYQREEDLAALREGKADIASALARGDVASAASAALQLQRTMAGQRYSNMQKGIEQARQEEIEAVEKNINNLKEQRKYIEEEIANLQQKQRDKQDEIYNIQKDYILPAENEIYRLQGLINEEADKLDTQYNNAANELINLQTQLAEALRLQRELNAAKTAQPTATTESQASIAGSGYMGLPIFRAFGGKVNYKGSTERAPGFMMGGRIKKYATGSFVAGSGMTDKVPAMLTPGEFVVRKSVAQQYAPLLENLNGQVYPKLGSVGASGLNFSAPSFSGGAGFSASDIKFNVPPNINSFMYPQSTTVGTETKIDTNTTNYVSGPTTVQYNYNLSVSAGTNASPDDIANTIIYKIKRLEDRNIKGTQVG